MANLHNQFQNFQTRTEDCINQTINLPIRFIQLKIKKIDLIYLFNSFLSIHESIDIIFCFGLMSPFDLIPKS